MAKTLSNNGIVLNQIIYPQQVSQSIDAFTGADNYDITISGSFTVTGSTSIDGNVTVDGAITMEGNVVAPNLTSTAQSNVVTYNSINGQFYYTSSAAISPATASNAVSASYAATASYVQNTQTASYVTLAQTASYVATASWAFNAVTASYVKNAQTASYVLNAVSASYASTASYVANAQTASYVTLAQTSSYYAETDPVFVSKSASLATTGSNIFSGSQTISGSINQQGIFYPDVIDWVSSSIQNTTGSYILTTTTYGVTTYANYQDVATRLGDYLVTTTSFNSYTGSNTSQFAGTASYATSASYAVSSSAANSAISASYSTTASFAQNTTSASYAVSASHANSSNTASYAIFASSSLIANTLDKQDYLLYKNTFFANEGVKDVSTALAELGSSQGSVLYIGPGVYSGSDVSITTPNISLNAPESGAGPGSTITQLSGARGVTISGASVIRVRLNNMQLGTNGLTINGTLGRHRVYNCQLPQIVFTGATTDFIYFDKCDIGNITIPNTFAGVVYILNSTISGTITNNAPLGSQQLIISNTTGIPSAFTTYYNAGIVYNTLNETLVSTTQLTASNAKITGSLFGTASYAMQTATASYVTTAQTASYVTLAQTASYVNQAVSASYSTTASYVANAQTASYITLAQTASYVATASYSNNSTTASYALTASYLTGYVSPFPFTGSAQITGSLGVTGSANISGDLVVNGTASFNVFHTIYNSSSIIYASGSTKFGDTSDDTHQFTGSLYVSGSVTADTFTGTASYATQATTASFVTLAQTASYVTLAQTASYVNQAVSSSYSTTASFVANAQTASYVNQAISASFASTASYVLNAVSSSFAATASYVNQLNQTVNISGSLNATGSVNIYKSGSSPLVVSGSQGPLFEITDSVSGSLWTIYTGSSPIFDVSSGRIMTLSGSATITGSLNVQNGITGSLFGTASYATQAATASYVLNAVSASYATTASYVALAQTASYVLNAISSSFASTSSFVNQLNQTVRISGSLNVTGSANIYQSGSTVFAVSGSNGPLFDITDVVSGSLFTVWTGSNRILQANSDYTTILGGASSAAALFTTTKNTANSGSTTIYTLPTASYDSIHVDYNIRSGSVSRAGNLFAIWSGSSVNQIETSASSFGDTSGFTFGVIVSGSNLALTGSTSTSSWTVKTIIRSI